MTVTLRRERSEPRRATAAAVLLACRTASAVHPSRAAQARGRLRMTGYSQRAHDRHPEARAKRASKGDGRCGAALRVAPPRPSILRGPQARGRLRMTGHTVVAVTLDQAFSCRAMNAFAVSRALS